MRRPHVFSSVALTCALSLTLVAATSRQNQPQPQKGCTGPEYRQFDFWVGEWTVQRPDGKPAGTNRIERIASGCGLQETWTSAGGGSGRSLNAYSAEDRQWHQTWIGSDGVWLVLAGGRHGDRMVMEGETTDAKGTLRHRISWSPQPGGRIRQVWEQSRDGGKTWQVAFDGLYLKPAGGASH